MHQHSPRRSFLKRMSLSGLGLSSLANAPITPGQPDAGEAPKPSSIGFPAGFLWGTATAAYQVEGAVRSNGRGESIWDPFVHTPGKLLGKGILPFATLYHWDLPQHLQTQYGGWRSKHAAERFAAYAGLIASKLGNRIRHFFTINEMYTFVEFGYGSGALAPGLKLAPRELNQVRHHVLLAHGLAVQAI